MKLWMAPEGLHIEPGLGQDAAALSQLHAESFFRGWPESEFSAYLDDPAATPAYIACNPRRDVRAFALLRLTGNEAELLTLAVSRRLRGRGVGSAVMRAVLEDLRMSPVTQMFLEVDEDNKSALALYHRLGFSQIGERNAYYPKPDGSAATARVLKFAFD